MPGYHHGMIQPPILRVNVSWLDLTDRKCLSRKNRTKPWVILVSNFVSVIRLLMPNCADVLASIYDLNLLNLSFAILSR